tara:strand:+ start:626 stop:1630 length:1005 start_codon:yes stop_codon:yes gene_type:complete
MIKGDVVFRLVGNEELGIGHIHRCITLARKLSLTGHFMIPESSALASKILQKNGFHCEIFSSFGDFLEMLSLKEPVLLVNDVLDTSEEEMKSIREIMRGFIVNFEDLGSGRKYADLVINALYQSDSKLENERFGPKWVCLRDEFSKLNRYDHRKLEPTIMVIFGGTDPSGYTSSTLEVLQSLPESESFRLIVVAGPGFSNSSSVSKFLHNSAKDFKEVSFFQDVESMCTLMQKSDFAITSNGRTVFEFASQGIPMIVICQNERELKHTFTDICGGAINLGVDANFPRERAIAAIKSLLDPSLRAKMSKSLLKFEIRSGVDRVVDEILKGLQNQT